MSKTLSYVTKGIKQIPGAKQGFSGQIAGTKMGLADKVQKAKGAFGTEEFVQSYLYGGRNPLLASVNKVRNVPKAELRSTIQNNLSMAR